MRTNNKRRFAPLFGIIAVVAIIGFLMIACKDEPDPPPPPLPPPDGELVVTADYGLYVGYPVKATPRYVTTIKSENYKFFWFRTNAAIYDNWKKAVDPTDDTYTQDQYDTYLGTLTETSLDSQTQGDVTSGSLSPKSIFFSPSSATSYVAGLLDQELYDEWVDNPTANPFPTILFSKPFTIAATSAIPTPQGQYYGNWGPSAEFQPADDLTGPKATEKLVIGENIFKLESTQVKAGVQQGIHWYITSWSKLPDNSPKLTWPATDAVPAATYDHGYTVTVSEIPGTNRGYTGFTSFLLLMKDSAATIVRTNQNAATGMTNAYTVRLYGSKTALSFDLSTIED